MDKIMTLEEVSEYLRISERTVSNWAQKGEIPGGKLGTSWRFRKNDIERWIDARMNSNTHQSQHKTLHLALPPERIIFKETATKTQILEELINLLSNTPFVKDREELKKSIYEREKLMSTGIGCGIGVPHVRLESVSDVVIAMAICKEGIKNYESLDGKPVKIVCMLAAHQDQHTQYLRTLSAISSKLKEITMREKLINSKDTLEACDLMNLKEY